MAQLLSNQAKLSLLTSNSEGAARPMEVIVSCTEVILKKTALLRDSVKQMTEAEQPMDEADLILKPETSTAAGVCPLLAFPFCECLAVRAQCFNHFTIKAVLQQPFCYKSLKHFAIKA